MKKYELWVFAEGENLLKLVCGVRFRKQSSAQQNCYGVGTVWPKDDDSELSPWLRTWFAWWRQSVFPITFDWWFIKCKRKLTGGSCKHHAASNLWSVFPYLLRTLVISHVIDMSTSRIPIITLTCLLSYTASVLFVECVVFQYWMSLNSRIFCIFRFQNRENCVITVKGKCPAVRKKRKWEQSFVQI